MQRQNRSDMDEMPRLRIARETIARYQRFMAVKGSVHELTKIIEFYNLSPGCTWRTVTDNGGRKYISTKALMAEYYALSPLSKRAAFVQGSMIVLEEKCGTKWQDDENGLW